MIENGSVLKRVHEHLKDIKDKSDDPDDYQYQEVVTTARRDAGSSRNLKAKEEGTGQTLN